MRRTESLLEKAPRPEYEKDFGHQVEKLVENFITNKVPGMHCEHASVSEDLTEATDTWLILEKNDKRFPLQITMTSSEDMLRRKEMRGPIVVCISKKAAKEAWDSYSSTLQENDGVEFNYEFLPEKTQHFIIEQLMSHPDIKRYMLAQANQVYYREEN